jgi:hypothetical protein
MTNYDGPVPAMGHAHGFIWTDESRKALFDLIVDGNTMNQAAGILSERYGYPISMAAVHGTMQRAGWRGETMVVKNEAKTYKNLTIPMDDYMVSCDQHPPYHSELWMNRLLMIAERFKIRKHIIAGDFYDMSAVSKFLTEEPKDVDKEVIDTEPAFKMIDYFDKNYFIQGNHERRIGAFTEGALRAKHMYKVFGMDKYDSKIVYSIYDRIAIEDRYLIMHPKSYSQISTAVSKRMAEKFHCHILNAHGHFSGVTFDRSGRYLCVDLGGLFDTQKIEYTSIKTTTHPCWNNGFGMIRNGKFTLFHQETDWTYWLDGQGEVI